MSSEGSKRCALLWSPFIAEIVLTHNISSSFGLAEGLAFKYRTALLNVGCLNHCLTKIKPILTRLGVGG